jgi:hypothetical protein
VSEIESRKAQKGIPAEDVIELLSLIHNRKAVIDYDELFGLKENT